MGYRPQGLKESVTLHFHTSLSLSFTLRHYYLDNRHKLFYLTKQVFVISLKSTIIILT